MPPLSSIMIYDNLGTAICKKYCLEQTVPSFKIRTPFVRNKQLCSETYVLLARFVLKNMFCNRALHGKWTESVCLIKQFWQKNYSHLIFSRQLIFILSFHNFTIFGYPNSFILHLHHLYKTKCFLKAETNVSCFHIFQSALSFSWLLNLLH